MGYIGNTNSVQNFTPAVDYFNGNGSTTSFTLSRTVGSAFDVQAFIENVPQNPSSAFTVAGNVITFTSAPPSGTNNIYVRYTSPVTQLVKPAPGTVSPTEINSAYSLWNLSGSDINYTTGNVGIGTSSPTEKLDVLGNTDTTLRVRAASDTALILNETTPNKTWKIKSSDGTLAFQYSSTAYNSGYSSRMLLDSSGNLQFASTTGAAIRWQNGYQTITGDAATDVLTYRTYATHVWKTLTSAGSNTDGTERMRIDSSGNVLVGTTNSSIAKFAVNGNGYFDTQLGVAVAPSAAASITVTAALNSGNGGNPQNCIRCNTNQSPGSNPFISFYNLSGNLAGSITHTGTTTVAYNTSSDYRLKENIAPMTGALAKVAALKPCTYTWKEDGTDGQGFIAHELQEVCPDAVSGEKDAVNEDGSINPQGVDTSFLVATLTAAIQEQQAIIENLKARIEVLEAK